MTSDTELFIRSLHFKPSTIATYTTTMNRISTLEQHQFQCLIKDMTTEKEFTEFTNKLTMCMVYNTVSVYLSVLKKYMEWLESFYNFSFKFDYKGILTETRKCFAYNKLDNIKLINRDTFYQYLTKVGQPHTSVLAALVFEGISGTGYSTLQKLRFDNFIDNAVWLPSGLKHTLPIDCVQLVNQVKEDFNKGLTDVPINDTTVIQNIVFKNTKVLSNSVQHRLCNLYEKLPTKINKYDIVSSGMCFYLYILECTVGTLSDKMFKCILIRYGDNNPSYWHMSTLKDLYRMYKDTVEYKDGIDFELYRPIVAEIIHTL